MNQNLKDMLQSDIEEDVRLALIMARQLKVPATEVAKAAGIIHGQQVSGHIKQWPLVYSYIRSTHMGRKWKWRKEL